MQYQDWAEHYNIRSHDWAERYNIRRFIRFDRLLHDIDQAAREADAYARLDNALAQLDRQKRNATVPWQRAA